LAPIFPKKHLLGPQNGSGDSRPGKLPKTINYATIKETKKTERDTGGGPGGIGGWPPTSTRIIVLCPFVVTTIMAKNFSIDSSNGSPLLGNETVPLGPQQNMRRWTFLKLPLDATYSIFSNQLNL